MPDLPPARLLDAFFGAAVTEAERALGWVKAVGAAAGIVGVTLGMWDRVVTLSPRAWGSLAALLLFFGWGLLGTRRPVARWFARHGRAGSVLLDALMAWMILLPNTLFALPDYAGVLRYFGSAVLVVSTAAVATRLSTPAAVAGVMGHAVAFAALLALDAALHPEVLTYGTLDVLIAVAVFTAASGLGLGGAYWVQRLAVEGARALYETRRTRERLDPYLPEDVADEVVHSTAFGRLGGRRQRVAIVFCDLRGFTAWSERTEPERLVLELNAYFEAMVTPIRAHGGAVDKFIGDAVMAVFGIPEPRDDDAARAIEAALAMRRALIELNDERAEMGLPPLHHGIGVHVGEVVAGNVGTSDRRQYTVVGDVVNVASRLESSTKSEGVDLLVSDETVEAAGGLDEVPELTPHRPLTLSGRFGTLHTWTVGR